MTESFSVLPLLDRGKHRNPRRGACFMELASYLAGERWSDHPQCTHPLLAMLARAVNDMTSDAARPQLAPLIPSVIGLTSQDPHWDVHIALRAATTALPIAAMDTQRVLAVAIIGVERVLDELDDRPAASMSPSSADALEQCPRTAIWAAEFCAHSRIRPSGFVRHAIPNIISAAVRGIAEAAVADPDTRLRDLLAATIADCRTWSGAPDAEPLTAAEWVAVVRPAS